MNADETDAAADQSDLEFDQALEDHRSQQADEQSASRATGGCREIKRRQVTRGWFQSDQLAVTHHADEEQRRKMHDQLRQDRPASRLKRHQRGTHHGDHHRDRVGAARIPLVAIEDQDERQQVQRQRQDPQEWDHGHVETNLIGRRQQHRRGTTAQAEPQPFVLSRRPNRILRNRGSRGTH